MSDEQLLQEVKKLLNEFLIQMGLDAEITTSFDQADEDKGFRYVKVELKGENLQELIGFHGANLEAIQIILGMMLNKRMGESDERVRLLIDINDYKASRIKYLESLAIRAAQQVKESGQSMELRPMKPFERRIVHMHLKNETGIKTESSGEGEDRKITILPTEDLF